MQTENQLVMSEAAKEMQEAIEYYLKGIQHFYKCINFAKSNLDSDAIIFMNDSEINFRKALKAAKDAE